MHYNNTNAATSRATQRMTPRTNVAAARPAASPLSQSELRRIVAEILG
jgi:hypothetical protein